MYVNAIDEQIDEILNNFHAALIKDPTFLKLYNDQIINFVIYREQINDFIKSFSESATTGNAKLESLVNNQNNLKQITDIITRYIAYWYFLLLAYYYPGTAKDFANNIIQYSAQQEKSNFKIPNFFDSVNNSQLLRFFDIIKNASEYLLMTPSQKEIANQYKYADTIAFLKQFGDDYIDRFLLTVNETDPSNPTVTVDDQNLIKTIVFIGIYQNQDQTTVFKILNETEESEGEYKFIDVVVENDVRTDLQSLTALLAGATKARNVDSLATDLFNLFMESETISEPESVESKNSKLLTSLPYQHPIVDDFLRYHRDTDRIDVSSAFNPPILTVNNAKNVQAALLYQQRKKKENTKAQAIVTKLDAITDLYSSLLDPKGKADVLKFFQGFLSDRKVVTHNYLEELKVLGKIIKQGRNAVDSDEYLLELQYITNRAYFPFKDFKAYGAGIYLEQPETVDVVRYSNIEFQQQRQTQALELHTNIHDETINVVGFTAGPFSRKFNPIQCISKSNAVDIRSINFSYVKSGSVRKAKSPNGYALYKKIVKHAIIETFYVDENLELRNDFSEVVRLNPSLDSKVIYWIFDPELDTFNLDTYETTKSHSFQETTKLMNTILYESFQKSLRRRLAILIRTSGTGIFNNGLKPWDKSQLIQMVQIYSDKMKLNLTEDEKADFIVQNYLQVLEVPPSTVSQPKNLLEMPTYVHTEVSGAHTIKIDLYDPTMLRQYSRIEAHSQEARELVKNQGPRVKCEHENAWNSVQKLISGTLNDYNIAVSGFIDRYVIETAKSDYNCKVCGQMLPMKSFVQDGAFDPVTQKFIAAYAPIDTPLQEVTGYDKYATIIAWLDNKITQLSLITNTNVYVGINTQARQKRKLLIKNTIDLFTKHSQTNMRRAQKPAEREAYMQSKFGVNPDLDVIRFFELSDNIVNVGPDTDSEDLSIKRFKRNNLLLYLLLLFIGELSGAQISLMTFDKIANIYTYTKYSQKFFGDLKLRRAVNGSETVLITEYPILCYLLHSLSYFYSKYRIWDSGTKSDKVYEPVQAKVIINSFVDLFNSISMDAGRQLSDYVYSLNATKMYTQLNQVFKNGDIVEILMKTHDRYGDPTQISTTLNYKVIEEIQPLLIGVSKLPPFVKHRLLSYKIGQSIDFYNLLTRTYRITNTSTAITNCPQGTIHEWMQTGPGKKETVCEICGEHAVSVSASTIRTEAVFYYRMGYVAKFLRCLSGTLHNFEQVNNREICTICHRPKDDTYTKEEIDKLTSNLNKLDAAAAHKLIKKLEDFAILNKRYELAKETVQADLTKSFNKAFSKNANAYADMIAKFTAYLQQVIGGNVNLTDGKNPIYVQDDVYIINVGHDGARLARPITFTFKDKRIFFEENNPFFKVDVYYYVDNSPQAQVTVYYDAITLAYIGYKSKLGTYERKTQKNNYLTLIPSVKKMLETIAYESNYVNIEQEASSTQGLPSEQKPEKLFESLDNTIIDHLQKMKYVADRFTNIFNKTKNIDAEPDNEAVSDDIKLSTTQSIEKIANKYGKLLANVPFHNIFSDWQVLRNGFTYEPVDWASTTILTLLQASNKINVEQINYYDIASTKIMFYLLESMTKLLEDQTNHTNKTNLGQFYVDVIVYIYNIFNIDSYKNDMDIKRFQFLLKGSNVMVDLLRQGQGLTKVTEQEEENITNTEDVEDIGDLEITNLTEEEQEEIENLKEEAEALDIDHDYYMEEDEDYGGGGEYED
jgi:hypothetical protein